MHASNLALLSVPVGSALVLGGCGSSDANTSGNSYGGYGGYGATGGTEGGVAGSGGTAGVDSGTGGSAGTAGSGGVSGGGGTAGTSGSAGTAGSGGDPCLNANCDPVATCSVQNGAAVCTCPSGYTDVNNDGSSCLDIDECQTNTDNCDANATWTNTTDSFTCTCN